MVVIGIDLLAAVAGIIGFFSHLIKKGLELFTMTKEALKMALDNSNIKQNLQRLQDLAAAYRDRTLSQLGKDAIDDCVSTCRDTYNIIEVKLLKIQGSRTKFSRGLKAMWQSNDLKELMSKMELSNTKLRDVLIMNHLQAGLDNAVRKEIQHTERTFALAVSRSGYSDYQHHISSVRPPRKITAMGCRSNDFTRVGEDQDYPWSDEKGSKRNAEYELSKPPVRYKTWIKTNFSKHFPTTTITQIYDTSDEYGSGNGDHKAIELREVITTQPQARLRSMKATRKQTVEETPTSRKVSVEESIEFKFADRKPRQTSCCNSCVVM